MARKPTEYSLEGLPPEDAEPGDVVDGTWMLLAEDEQDEMRRYSEAEAERRRTDPEAAQEWRERMARLHRERREREAQGEAGSKSDDEA